LEGIQKGPNLKTLLEADTVKAQNAPVRACHRYIKNRPYQLDYKAALAQGLPIGSGEQKVRTDILFSNA